jgi:guanine nucleotide-binding protein G(i) subunit alpha
LLGAGESGKSTLFKQMKKFVLKTLLLYKLCLRGTDYFLDIFRLYGVGWDERERNIYKPGIHRNILTSCKELFIQSGELDPKRFPRSKISTEAKTAGEAIEALSDGAELDEKNGELLATLWKDKGIQETYAYSSAYQMIDSIEYFMENITRICKAGYIPSYQDCLRCRIRTTGVVEFKFEVDNNQFTIIDVGGQRSERKKWLHCFQDVTAVIFVAAISEYDQVLFEDAKTNRLLESISLFNQIVNYNCFKDKTSLILFLNKCDLLQEKIKKVPLTVCFDDYDSENTYDDACDYFKDVFAAQIENTYTQKLYIHITCATDTEMIANVFSAVKDILLQQSLMTSGLIE